MDVDEVLEEGMDQLEQLPAKVQKYAAEIKEEDFKCSEMLKDINIKVAAYTKASTKLSREQKEHHLAEIFGMYDKAEAMARNKVGIASKLYEDVDEDISKMDKTTKKLEAGSRRHSDDEPSTSDGGRKKKKKKKRKGGERDEEECQGSSSLPYVEMPVDPNEPIYCTCHQVSFGEMICCDNSDCKVEWYHYQCVGIKSTPSTSVKWYCEICRPKFKSVANQWNYDTNDGPARKGRKAIKEEAKDE